MLVAREKLKTNIVEYVLYMYHMEDIIRANHLNMIELDKNVISKYNLSANQLEEVRNWYRGLIAQMEKEDIQKTGHLSSIKEIIFQLNDLHIQLLNTLNEERYIVHYRWASGFIKELKTKMDNPELTEIEVCLNGLYAVMLLKMKKLEITEETSEAMEFFSQMLRYLSKKYNYRQ